MTEEKFIKTILDKFNHAGFARFREYGENGLLCWPLLALDIDGFFHPVLTDSFGFCIIGNQVNRWNSECNECGDWAGISDEEFINIIKAGK